MIIADKKEILKLYKNKKLGEYNIRRRAYRLPIKGSKDLAGIVGDVLTDGHISKGMVMYFSKYEDEI